MRTMLICAAFLCGGLNAQSTFSIGQVVTHDTVEYRNGETGHVSNLGITYDVRPEVSSQGLVNFYVHASYQDPGLPDAPAVELLPWTVYPGICDAPGEVRDLGSHSQVNRRGTRFAIFVKLRCKATPLSQPALAYLPYLDVSFGCSDLPKELRYLNLIKSNHVFDVSPATVLEQIASPLQQAVQAGRAVYEVYSTVSTILDGLSLVNGAITIADFMVKLVVGYVKDQVVDAAFNYVESAGKAVARFQNVGWSLMCMLCGERFTRTTLTEGEIVECPRPDCRMRAAVHFPR